MLSPTSKDGRMLIQRYIRLMNDHLTNSGFQAAQDALSAQVDTSGIDTALIQAKDGANYRAVYIQELKKLLGNNSSA